MIRRLLQPARYDTGFTLVELLVVMAVIVTLLGLMAPAVGILSRSGVVDTGVNTVNVAVTAARGYVNKGRTDLAGVMDSSAASFTTMGGTTSAPIVPQYARFGGNAILFTPSNEIRFLKNDQFAIDGSASPKYLKDNTTVPGGYNGYVDLPGRDYILLPKELGVLGVDQDPNKTPGASALRFFAPPFALRFNEYGNLVSAIRASNANSAAKMVFYDGNNAGKINITNNDRNSISNYNPDAYDPSSPNFVPANYLATVGKYKVPFGQIEAVVGVVVYNRSDLRSLQRSNAGKYLLAVTNLSSGGDTNSWINDQIKGNAARVVFFSRYTGALFRE